MNPCSSSRRASLALLAALAAIVAVLAACSSSGSKGAAQSGSGATSSAAAFPVTLQAGDGSHVTISKRPTAIISLSPTATEDLFAIGAGTQVKAVDKNSDYPAEAPHSDLDAYQLNTEAVAAKQPDLVVASGLTKAQAAQFANLQIPVLDEPAATDLQQAYDQITLLGRATGHTAGAAALVGRMQQQIAAIVSDTPKPAGDAAMYYYELDQTYYSVTSDTFIGKLLGLLGLKSIADAAKGAAASGGYPQLSAEYVLHAQPELVFLADTLCCKQSVSTLAQRPGWAAMPALQLGHVVELNDDVASRWGPRIVDLLRTAADAVKTDAGP
jgi:iron complex transport system substrate-binding protein